MCLLLCSELENCLQNSLFAHHFPVDAIHWVFLILCSMGFNSVPGDPFTDGTYTHFFQALGHSPLGYVVICERHMAMMPHVSVTSHFGSVSHMQISHDYFCLF